MPKVSVIINAKSRPAEVIVALRSVLAQTFKDKEVLVIVDGPEPETEEALARFASSFPASPFRVVTNRVCVGLAEARNIGVRSSYGDFVAFLDDDDEWFPTKLEEQLKSAEELAGSHLFIACRFVERSDRGDKVWPETLPGPHVAFSEYLFVHRGMLLPSTFLISRVLIEEIPFAAGLRHVEDIDWMLRAAADPRTQIAVNPSVLALYNNQPVPGRESRNLPWYTNYIWSVPRRHLFTPLAYSCFITRSVVSRAKDEGASSRQLLHLFSAAMLLGSFNSKAILSFIFSFFLSTKTKAWGRRFITRSASENPIFVETRR